MKTSTTLVTMTLMLLLLALTLPAGAADYTLGIFGNANEDETINMQDVTYTELIILEYRDETELADGKHDGKINMQDVTQIELVILGRELEITLLDSADRIVTVEKPVERIIAGHCGPAEAIPLLGAWDRVVGRDYYVADEILFPGVSNLPVCVSPMSHYDAYYETVFELDPDIFLTTYLPFTPGFEDIVDTLEPEGISVVALSFNDPATLVENIRKLRYILNTKDEGDAFIDFYEGVVNRITEKTGGLTDDEKPQVFYAMLVYDYQNQYMTIAGDYPGIQSQLDIVGATNIAEDLTGWYPYIGDEWLIGQDIDVIACSASPSIISDIFGYGVDDTTVARETRDWIMDADENPALSDSDAVTDGRVYLYQMEMIPTPRVVVALAYMAKWFHPELFGDDFDPKAIHQEYLTDFMGVDCDLDDHGVLFYPEP